MPGIKTILNKGSDLVWSWPLIILLFGTHIYLTIRLKFIQRYIGRAIKISFSRKQEGKGDIRQFGSLMTALAATIGTGNIVGVATAVASGGPDKNTCPSGTGLMHRYILGHGSCLCDNRAGYCQFRQLVARFIRSCLDQKRLREHSL